MILESLAISLLAILFAYVTVSVAWPFVLSLTAAVSSNNESQSNTSTFNNILVLIPAYKEDAVITDTVEKCRLQNYPHSKFKTVVIADSLKQSTLRKLAYMDASVLEVNWENSTKSKSLNHALEQYDDGSYDMVVILDADNHMCDGFLLKVNHAFNLGYKAIQGQRVAKNDNGSMSILDGLSEALNNHIFCKGQYLIGGSSRLAGSGMAFDYQLLKECMKEIDVINGFDKHLELNLTKRGERIIYIESAKILDEKVSRAQDFKNQRTRWIAAQYICFSKNLKDAFFQVFKNNNWDYFQKVMLMGLPPKLAFLPLLLIGLLLSVITGAGIGMVSFFTSMMVLFVATYVMAIPSEYRNIKNLKHLAKLPLTIVMTLAACFNMKKAAQKFIHTPHDVVHEIK